MSNTKNKFFLTLLGAMAIGAGSIFAAEDTTVTTPPPAETVEATAATTSEPTPLVVTGKVVVVDKTAGTITLEVDGKLQLLKVARNVKMVNQDKLVTLAQLLPGQRVAVLTRPGTAGTVEIVALSVEPGETALSPAGEGGGGGGRETAPFPTLANPANNLGPIISPSE